MKDRRRLGHGRKARKEEETRGRKGKDSTKIEHGKDGETGGKRKVEGHWNMKE